MWSNLSKALSKAEEEEQEETLEEGVSLSMNPSLLFSRHSEVRQASELVLHNL